MTYRKVYYTLSLFHLIKVQPGKFTLLTLFSLPNIAGKYCKNADPIEIFIVVCISFLFHNYVTFEVSLLYYLKWLFHLFSTFLMYLHPILAPGIGGAFIGSPFHFSAFYLHVSLYFHLPYVSLCCQKPLLKMILTVSHILPFL